MSRIREEVRRATTLRPPDMVFDESKAAQFDVILRRAADRSGAIDYTSEAPKYEFLTYLADRRGLLMHGSNNPNIEVFEPRMQPDALGRAARRVYAAADGIWPMFYAIIDRRRYRGSLRNWCLRRGEEEAQPGRCYYFSINREVLATGEAWRQGTIYILPRETFTATTDDDGSLTQEWSSELAVTPVARLTVVPEDFPFLDQVQGHDDSWALRIEELQLKLVSRFAGLSEVAEATYELRFRRANRLRSQLTELVTLVEQFEVLTDVRLAVVERERGEPALHLSGAGAAQLASGINRFRGPIKVLGRVPGVFPLLMLLRRRQAR